MWRLEVACSRLDPSNRSRRRAVPLFDQTVFPTALDDTGLRTTVVSALCVPPVRSTVVANVTRSRYTFRRNVVHRKRRRAYGFGSAECAVTQRAATEAMTTVFNKRCARPAKPGAKTCRARATHVVVVVVVTNPGDRSNAVDRPEKVARLPY